MNKKVVVINVLSHEYYKDCHIKTSISIPLDQLEQTSKQLDKDTEIVVYCASNECPLSRKAYKLLKKLGFEKVLEYSDGIREWVHRGFPTEGTCKADFFQHPHKSPLPKETGIEVITAQELKNKLKL